LAGGKQAGERIVIQRIQRACDLSPDVLLSHFCAYLRLRIAGSPQEKKGLKAELLGSNFPFSELFESVFDILSENGGCYAQERS
jgi:hypothetical protein